MYVVEFAFIERSAMSKEIHDPAILNPVSGMTQDADGAPVRRAVQSDDIERKRTEETLRESENRFHILFEQAAVGVALVDTKTGRYLDINRSYCDFLGYTKEEMLNMSFQDVTFPDDVQENIENNALLLAGKIREFSIEKRYIRKDGRTVWGNLTASPLWVPGEETSDYLHIAVVQDITRRKQAEEEIQNLAKFPDEDPNPILRIARDGTLIYINRAGSSLLPEWHLQEGQAAPSFLREAVNQSMNNETTKVIDLEYGERVYSFFVVPIVASGYTNLYAHDISERKRAEDALRASEEKYRLLIENVGEGIGLTNPEEQFTFVNPAAGVIFGVPTGMLSGRNLREFTIPEQFAMIREQTRKRQAGEKSVYEIEIKRPDGERRNLLVTAAPQFDSQGEFVGTFGVFRDITERKQAEVALQHERDFAESMIETAQVIVLVMDTQGRIVRFNPYMEEVSGYALAEVQGLDWFTTFLPERDRECTHNLFLKALGGIPTLGNVNPIVTKDGVEREVEWYDKMLKDVQGNVVGLLSVGQDITERKRAEESLRNSENKFSKAFRASPDVLIISQRDDGLIIETNDSWERLFGYSREEVIGRSSLELGLFANPADRQNIVAQLQEQIFVHDFEVEIKCKSGKVRRTSLSVEPIEIDSKPCMLTMIHDISERKRVEEALRENEEKLRVLFEQLPIGVSLLDQNRKVIYDNPALEKMLDLSRDDLLQGRHQNRRYIRSDGTPMPLEEYASMRAFQEQQPVRDVEIGLITESGKTIWTSVSAAPFPVADRGVVVATLNITERKRAEEALRLSEKTARQTAEQLRMVNQIAVKITTGLDFEQFMQTIYEQCQQIGATDAFFIALYDDATGMVSFPFNYRYGERRSVAARNIRENPGLSGYVIEHCQTLYIPDFNSLPVGITLVDQLRKRNRSFVGVPLLLNERVVGVLSMQFQLQNAYSPEHIRTLELLATQVAVAIQNSQLYAQVQDERNLANTLIDHLPGFFGMVDQQGRLVRWNKYGGTIAGYTPEDFGDLGLLSVVPVEEQARLTDLLGRGFAGEQVTTIVDLVTKEGGKKASFEGTGTRVQIGNDAYLLIIGIDVTDRKRAEAELEQSREQLRALTAYLQTAIEEERAKIAREIHDEFGQSMTALKMDLTWLAKRLPEGGEKIERIHGMTELVDDSIRLMRRIASSLRPGILDDLGLVAAIRWMATGFKERTGISCDMSLPQDDLNLDSALNTTLFRIFQEALTNVSRHAQATVVNVSLQRIDQTVILVIQDNGRGITEAELADPRALGLLGLHERAAQWRGDLTIHGAPGEGTTVTVRIPLPDSPAKGGGR
jgi:PAS domain S-box-containing protein